MILRSTRPVYPFSISHVWQASCGSEAIGPLRAFAWEAIDDLPPAARVEPGRYRIDGLPTYTATQPYGVRRSLDLAMPHKWNAL